jgi:hypothetical protein
VHKWLWRLAVIVAVLILASGVGYSIKAAPPTYRQSATVLFSAPRFRTAADAYSSLAPSLITSAAAMIQVLLSPGIQRKIRAAGGTADINMALTNLYSEEYPDYGEPLAGLTVTSSSAAIARHTFRVTVRRLRRILRTRQEQAGVPRRHRISAQILGKTGLVIQAGSLKRVFAGLALLAIVAISALWSFLDQQGPGRNQSTVPR